jgi:hypothetical protein
MQLHMAVAVAVHEKRVAQPEFLPEAPEVAVRAVEEIQQLQHMFCRLTEHLAQVAVAVVTVVSAT